MSDKELGRARALIQGYRDDIAHDTSEFLKIPSVRPDEPVDGDPLGPDIASALDYIGDLADKFGFTYRNLDGQAAVVEVGQGDETLGVLLHVDVVPAGDGWEHEPFGGEIVDGELWGRGAMDDKGPAISVLYALKALQDSGITLNKRVKVIFGTNEESGEWTGITHYLEKEGAPDMSIVPDADFPIINGEKGFCDLHLTSSHSGGAKGTYDIVTLDGGIRSNMVPDKATAVLHVNGNPADAYKELYAAAETFNAANPDAALTVSPSGDHEITVSATGRSAHGSTPAAGHNAIVDVASYLDGIDASDGAATEMVRFINDRIGYQTDGTDIGIAAHHDFLGDTTANLGIVYATQDEARATLNVRFPYGIGKEELPERVGRSADGYDIAVRSDDRALDPLYVDPSDPLVVSLQKAYTDVTGQQATLHAIGGTTYAKAMPRAVSFGPTMPGEPEMAHQPNERVTVDSLVRNAEIYAAAIYEICG